MACTLEVYYLALILSIMSYLSDSRRLKVCCTLVVTLEVTYLGTQLTLGLNCCRLVTLHKGGGWEAAPYLSNPS